MILDENLFAEYYDEDKLKLPFRVYMDGTEYTLNEEEIGWIFDDLSAVDVSPKDIVKYEGVGDADYFKLTFKDGSQKAWYIHSGMYIPDKDLDESLKESFEDEYNNCFVELCDGKPQFAYDRYSDASRGMFSSKMGDSRFNMGIHNYEIKYLKDGIYYDVDDDGNPVGLDESLTEDVDEVVAIEVPDVNVEIEAEETKPEGPAPGADTGITDLLLSLINDENSTIQTYNSFKASLEDHADFDDVINDIVAEEYNHVGMLQTLLRKISPNSVTIDAGEEEAEDILTKEDNDSLAYGEIVGEIDDSFDNGFGGIFA